ncbi:MAG: NADPH-dependent FMN reductase [Acholeplasmataceae bacterium]
MELKIGIILGSTRNGRVSPSVGQWVLERAEKHGRARYELIDIRDYRLPFLGESEDKNRIAAWNEKLASLDAFIFVLSEYNHSISGVLKNALDLAHEAWHDKAAGIVSYGSAGGARAAEHLRTILGELMVADVRQHVMLNLFHDFDEERNFKPQSVHEEPLNTLFDQVIRWGSALKSLR